MAEKPILRHPPDENARRLARSLLRAAPFAALAVLERRTGAPLASRVLLASSFAGDPVLLVSALSAHTAALEADARCSLLFGEPKRGDPLAFPRLSAVARAQTIEPGTAEHTLLRDRVLARHPYASLYIDFPDFRLVLARLERASLNGGFARAFDVERADLTDAEDPAVEAAACRALAHMNADHADAVERIAHAAGLPAATDGRRIVTGDARGFEMRSEHGLERIEFAAPVRDAAGFRSAYVALLGLDPGPA